ncbi:MAG: DNA mismatch repair endonuclease MutL [Colwelliaceae bacterium]|nr:DNA mismatch repair endonuclease MutL [Colwelliaceae bacterium]
MTIQILPARLANQIAAGEVVERPASVVKELVENSLDAGATKIAIDIEKGGAKKIRINDNGGGIAKDELTLALSRHATSKIKDLNDLEAISSLGFRGEALASISSVARLTLTSKPEGQESAWQAQAQGRDMEVLVQPAAHPKGTTIEVNDLFFNTPARRKFLRTEKTEFGHIDELVKRIALARFDVSFTLTHNGKVVRQYRAAKQQTQYIKRIAQVCGQKFVDSAVEVNCEHDGLHLWGWIARPDYYRTQNDLCYSYVNGRMMRDKLINHGIRQAFTDTLPSDTYPAFVLFLDLNYKDVDVNVHPAKHEVRFHQGRYVHDFIYTVCHQALQQSMQAQVLVDENGEALSDAGIDVHSFVMTADNYRNQSQSNAMADANAAGSGANSYGSSASQPSSYASDQSFIKPLQFVRESSPLSNQQNYSSNSTANSASGYVASYNANKPGSVTQASEAYQQLMTPVADSESSAASECAMLELQLIKVESPCFAVVIRNDKLQLLNLVPIAQEVNKQLIEQRWLEGLVSQPLLLPVVVQVEESMAKWINQHINLIEQAGIYVQVQLGHKIQIRQFPAMLRDQDVNQSFTRLLAEIEIFLAEGLSNNEALITALTTIISDKNYQLSEAKQLLIQAKSVLGAKLNSLCDLNSSDIDLTSALSQLQ